MSQLRKSASFRSRIPIPRRSNLPNRRCCSPPANINNSNDNDSNEYSNMPTKRSRRSQKSRNFTRRYSSSSYSSSDESFISDQPIKKKINHFNPVPELFYASNDALSLNALLDSVSSGGTFSSPPSPIHQIYGNSMIHHSSESYESLDRYDEALEKLRITDNLNNIGVKLPYPPHDETRRLHQRLQMNNLNSKQQREYNYHCYDSSSRYGSDPNFKVKQLKDDWYNLRNRHKLLNNDKRAKNNNKKTGTKIDENCCSTADEMIKNYANNSSCTSSSSQRHQGHRMKKILSKMPNSLLSSQDESSLRLPVENDLERKQRQIKLHNNRKESPNLHEYKYFLQQQQQQQQSNLTNAIVKNFNQKKNGFSKSETNNNNRKHSTVSTPSSPIPIQLNINESPLYLSRMAAFRDHIADNRTNIINEHGVVSSSVGSNSIPKYCWNQNEINNLPKDDTKVRDSNTSIYKPHKDDLLIPSAYNICYDVSQNFQPNEEHDETFEADSLNRKRNGGIFSLSPKTSKHSNNPTKSSNENHQIQQQRQDEEQHYYYNDTNLYGINNEMETLKIGHHENDINLTQQQQQQKRKHFIELHQNTSQIAGATTTSENIKLSTSTTDADTELYNSFNQENYKNMCRNMAVNSFQNRLNNNNEFMANIRMMTEREQNFSRFRENAITKGHFETDSEIYRKNNQRIEPRNPNYIENENNIMDVDINGVSNSSSGSSNNQIGWYKVNKNFWQLKKTDMKKNKQQQLQQQQQKRKEFQEEDEEGVEFEEIDEKEVENKQVLNEKDDHNSKLNKIITTKKYNNNNDRNGTQQDNNNVIDIDNNVEDDSEMYYQNIDEPVNNKQQNQHHHQQHYNKNDLNSKSPKYLPQLKNLLGINVPLTSINPIFVPPSENSQHFQFTQKPLTQFVKNQQNNNNNSNSRNENINSNLHYTSDNKNENGLFQQSNVIGIPTTATTTTVIQTAAVTTKYLDDKNYKKNNINSYDTQPNFDNEEYKTETTSMTTALSLSDRTKTPTNCGAELARKYLEAKRRPLPKIPVQDEIFPPKPTASYRSECELSGSYVSLECPSPPGPPACLPESRRDPQARLSNYLKTLYTDLALKEPIIPPWAIPVAPGALSPARLEPELRLHSQSHGFTDCLTIDQILLPLHTKDGNFLEAPRRVLIECPSWASRSNLALRVLHGWAREPPWPPKGTPIAMALLIPLAEIKRSFANYVEKELILKGPMNPFANGFGGFSAAWNSLETLGPKLLFVLDGYDNQRGSPKRKGKQYPPDVHDLLDGKLFPEARVIITTSIANCNELLPLIQRHITFEGLTWGRSVSLLGGGQWGAAPSRLLDTVQECPALRKIVRTPLGCLAIAAIFEATAGDLPTDELDVIESVLNCIAPETSSVNVAELGRLMLFCLKMKRPCITMSELRMYCSSPESNMLGCLDKGLLLGKSARKKGEYIYGPMCPDLAEFLAANYIASLSNRPGLLSAEITGLTIGDELDPDMLKVIKYGMGLLGPRSHVLLSKLTPLWLSPQTIFSLALAGGHSDDNLAALCDILGISKHPPISPLEAKPLWVQVRSAPTELMGWGMALKSPTCTLKNLELIYQLEKHHLLDARSGMEIFLDSLDMNESVSTLRITSLIENEVKDSEIGYLGSCVAKALVKPRLESFELILTLLEEDPPILKLQPVVSAICRSIPRQPKLNCLQLDLGLSTSQLVQLCSVLDKCPNITRLSLPHLRCERGAVTALATLLTARPLNFLSIPSCWGARDDPPSSSGVSMGSGSGSSTGTSGLIKQGSLTGVPSPRAYPPGLFSSLPRGMYVPTATMGRSATLPRQPIEAPPDKRSCDSVVSKTWYPTPACDGGPHSSGTLHDLLLAAREPYSKLHGLDLSKAQLSLEDSMCLGETVRLSNTLHTLKLEGSSRLSEILPSVLGASESPCLQMLSIGSPRLNLEDSVIAMSARSLTSCTTLRLLSLDGWSFRIEIPSTLSILRAFLSLTSIRELSLANCRLQIGIFKSDSKIVNPFESRSVVVLKLSSAQVTLGDSTIWKGPQLLTIISGFPCLRELDLSAPARSGLSSTTHSTPLIIDDKCLISFFQSLHTHFSLLNTLKICNWVIHFDDPTKTLKTISKCIRNSPISHLKLDGISVLDRAKKLRIESNFLHCFISSLPLLRWMGISLSGKKEDQITAIGNAVLDLKGYEIDIKLSESTIEHAKLMAQAISLDGKFDIKVSTFGTSSGILIHAEKSGTKSLNRKNNKD